MYGIPGSSSGSGQNVERQRISQPDILLSADIRPHPVLIEFQKFESGTSALERECQSG